MPKIVDVNFFTQTDRLPNSVKAYTDNSGMFFEIKNTSTDDIQRNITRVGETNVSILEVFSGGL